MRKHIFLIGMMGCGKSTMGRHLAERLGSICLDLDAEIVRREGMSIPELFTRSGDSGFRVCETAALKAACEAEPCIIATGGGIVTREENIALMREHGTVIWLCRPLDDIIAGVRQDTRPKLAGNKEERMRTLYAEREALYKRAAHIVFDNSAPPEEGSARLADLLSGLNP